MGGGVDGKLARAKNQTSKLREEKNFIWNIHIHIFIGVFLSSPLYLLMSIAVHPGVGNHDTRLENREASSCLRQGNEGKVNLDWGLKVELGEVEAAQGEI